ncbi:MAG: FKBP-type peptidyl-prolyl cis-trans isomerase [Planctomycetes bacterium]|nr:FKBP-type peptidyl-prolyl cis-trans isomerase [Planctomycetota bacterium]
MRRGSIDHGLIPGALSAALVLLVGVGGSSVARADDLPPAKQASLDSVERKASYGFGYQIGRQFRGQGLTVLLPELLNGLQDALGGKQPQLPEPELFNAMSEHQKATRTALARNNRKAGEVFLKDNAAKQGVVKLDSGLQYTVIQQGTGPKPKATDKVKTHYHGTLIDGLVFDSSVESGEPATFGVNEVIPGWTEALQLMKVGDKWRIVVPSELAYGVQGAPPDIGPNCVLIFEIELLGIEP